MEKLNNRELINLLSERINIEEFIVNYHLSSTSFYKFISGKKATYYAGRCAIINYLNNNEYNISINIFMVKDQSELYTRCKIMYNVNRLFDGVIFIDSDNKADISDLILGSKINTDNYLVILYYRKGNIKKNRKVPFFSKNIVIRVSNTLSKDASDTVLIMDAYFLNMHLSFDKEFVILTGDKFSTELSSQLSRNTLIAEDNYIKKILR